MKQYVFWHYDLFPYVLWGKVDKIENGIIYTGSFQFNFNNIITLVGEEEAGKLITDFKFMKDNYRNKLKDFDKQATTLIKRISK